MSGVKIVIPGGTGNVGTFLGHALGGQGHDVVVLSRRVRWAGRSVSCRYTEENLRSEGWA